MPAWVNSIVPVGTDSMVFQIEQVHFCIRHAPARPVPPVVEEGPYLQARLSQGAPTELCPCHLGVLASEEQEEV